MSPKMYKNTIIFSILPIVFSIVFVILFGIQSRKSLENRYNEGVQLYLNGKYSEALIIFDELRGWGDRIVEIKPEEYCEAIASKIDVKLCPECGAIIN